MNTAVLGVADVAAMLRCTEDTVRERATAGDLPGLKFGRDWVFPSEALHAELTRQALEQAAKRREGERPLAISRSVRKAPPTLPVLVDVEPSPRRAAKHRAATSSAGKKLP